MQLIKKNLIKYKKSSDEGFENFPAIISGAAGADSLPIGAEILIDNDAEVPNGWEVVDEKYDASEVYLANGQSVQEKLDNIAPTGVTAGTYGGYVSSSITYNIPNIGTDEYGRIINASESALTLATSKSHGLMSMAMYSHLGGNHISYTLYNLAPSDDGNYQSFQISNSNLTYSSIFLSSGSYISLPHVYGVYAHIKTNTDGRTYWVPVEYYCYKEVSYTIMWVKFPTEFYEFNSNQTTIPYVVLYEKPLATSASGM